MCDYSLMSVPNRLAVEGEPLVVHGSRPARRDWHRLLRSQHLQRSRANPRGDEAGGSA
jgi:hypothetical protein